MEGVLRNCSFSSLLQAPEKIITIRTYKILSVIMLNYEINNIITGYWALPRPVGKYKTRHPDAILKRLEALLGPYKVKRILHLFCGISRFPDAKEEIRVDINPEVNPDYVLDLRKDKLPFEDDSFDIVYADPPYYDFPPYCFVDEAVRVLKPAGFLVILHQLVYRTPKNTKRWAMIALSTGPNMRLRCLNIFRKNIDLTPRENKDINTIDSYIGAAAWQSTC